MVYSSSATSRCQKHKEEIFSPTLVPLNLRVVNGHGTEFSNVGTVFRDIFQAEFEDYFMDEFIAINDSLES